MADRAPLCFLATTVSGQQSQWGQDHWKRAAADQQSNHQCVENGSQQLTDEQHLCGSAVPSTQNQAGGSNHSTSSLKPRFWREREWNNLLVNISPSSILRTQEGHRRKPLRRSLPSDPYTGSDTDRLLLVLRLLHGRGPGSRIPRRKIVCDTVQALEIPHHALIETLRQTLAILATLQKLLII